MFRFSHSEEERERDEGVEDQDQEKGMRECNSMLEKLVVNPDFS